jgi:S-methylmethionine-dependent homocysteine/selenocysteine methylase
MRILRVSANHSTMKKTTYQKAEDLAWRYLRMAKQHVTNQSPGKLMEIGPWAANYADLEYVATTKIINAAKQHAFYDQAIQLLATVPAEAVAPAFTAEDLKKVYAELNK